jgi:hypothetical protein
MRFLFFYAILREHIEDDVRFYLKLTGQLVDTNLTHRKSNRGKRVGFQLHSDTAPEIIIRFAPVAIIADSAASTLYIV